MLYKKYHRNFVRQFKKGTRYKFVNSRGMVCEVNVEPFIDVVNIKVYSNIIKEGVYTTVQVQTTIINHNGQLMKYKKDVI